MKQQTKNQTAVSTFVRVNQEVANKLVWLQHKVLMMRELEIDDINWGHVGDLSRIKESLDDLIENMAETNTVI